MMHLPASIVERLPEYLRRRLFRYRLAHGASDRLGPLIARSDPFGAWTGLFRAVDFMLANDQVDDLGQLAGLADHAPPFAREIWQSLALWAAGDKNSAEARLGRLGEDTSLDGPHRDAALAWLLYLQLPKVAVGTGGPKGCMQFWDTAEIPADVAEAMDGWRQVSTPDYALFDDAAAAAFIRNAASPVEERLFLSCPHPAIRSDVFRLCYIMEKGGTYADADARMRSGFARVYAQIGPRTLLWFRTRNPLLTINNCFMSAPAGSPFVTEAFERACANAVKAAELHVYNIAGPALFTQLAVEMYQAGRLNDVMTATDHWIDAHVLTQFRAAYKSDDRNWHLWQQKRH